MRRITCLAATAILAVLWGAGAQAGSRSEGSDGSRWSQEDSGSGWRQSARQDRNDEDGWDDDSGPRGGSGRMAMHHRDMRDDGEDDDGAGGQHPMGGARFMLRTGDTRLAVQCGMGEPTRSCVDAAIQLMDRARAQPASPAQTGTTSPNPPAVGGQGGGGTTQP